MDTRRIHGNIRKELFMKAIANNIRLQFDEKDRPEIILSLCINKMLAITETAVLKELIAKEKPLSVEIKQHRKKRSLDANAYLWVLLSEIAAVIKSNKDDVYLTMLERYGIFTHIIVKPEAAERVKQEWRTCRVLGEVSVNEKKGVQIQCYYGSHLYDTKEFSVLLDGVISEARELGIETLTEREKALMIGGME